LLTLGEARQKACKGGGSTRKESVNGASTGLWLSLTSLQSSTPRAWWMLPVSNQQWNGDDMAVVVYLLLTVAIFAVLGTVLKLMEGL